MEINPEFLALAKKSVKGEEPKLSGPAPEPGKTETETKDKITKSPAKAVVDAVFMMDCTGSMGSFIAKAKETIKKMITDIKENYSESSIFVGFVAYRDHCDKDLIEFKDLTGDIEDVYKFIDTLKASGGGDEAEAIADGLEYSANKISWRDEDSLRLLIHVCDAPPHGKEFGGGDDYPEGCPCKCDYKELLKKLYKMKVQYLILNFTSSVDKMIAIFKQYHDDIDSIKTEGGAGGIEAEYDGEMPKVCDMRACAEDMYNEDEEEECNDIDLCEAPPMHMKEEAMPKKSKAPPKSFMPLEKMEVPMSMPKSAASEMGSKISSSVLSKAKKKWG